VAFPLSAAVADFLLSEEDLAFLLWAVVASPLSAAVQVFPLSAAAVD
jgi:hypothetical protein